jgi:hypothetical protein
VNPPSFDDDLGFFQRVEQLPVEKLIAYVCSVIPSFRQASSTASPLPVSSSIVRRCWIISSGVYRFLGMTLTSLVAAQSNIHPGPNLPGQVNEPSGFHINFSQLSYLDQIPVSQGAQHRPVMGHQVLPDVSHVLMKGWDEFVQDANTLTAAIKKVLTI